MSVFHNTLKNGLARIRNFTGVPLKYFAGDIEVEITKAVLGPARQVYHGNTFVETREIGIEAAELIDGDGNQIEPQVGHRLTEESGDKTYEYEVAILDERKPAWVWSDPHTRTQRRIFTTLIEVQ